jgi:Flp pilus assembly protein protease CpaA
MMVDAVLGAALGLVMVPLVYLLASRLLTGPAGMPPPAAALPPLILSCLLTGTALTALSRSVVGQIPWFTGDAGRPGAPLGALTSLAYLLFAVAVLAAATVDVVERRIPNKITYPLILVGVIGLPWLTQPVTWWSVLAPLAGAVASGVLGLINALAADQGLGDVKLATAIGAWTAHLGVTAWAVGVVVSQILMVAAVATTRAHRRRNGKPPEFTPLGPSLAGGAVLAAVAAAQFIG